MSSVASLIVKLKQLNITVQVRENNLKIDGPKENLTPELIKELKEQKPDILDFLRKVQKQERYTAIEMVEEREYYDVSFAQRRLWLLCQFEADSTAYNMPMAIEIFENFDPDIFQQALQALIQRHESLRTVFITVDDQPKQKIIKDLNVILERIDMSNF